MDKEFSKTFYYDDGITKYAIGRVIYLRLGQDKTGDSNYPCEPERGEGGYENEKRNTRGKMV